MTDPLTTPEDVRTRLEVSQSEYPSEKDDGVNGEKLLDKWIGDAHDVVQTRIPSTAARSHRRRLETLVAAHFGFPSKTGGTDGERVSSISQANRTINFDMNDVPGDTGATPYWLKALKIDDRLDTTPSDDYVISVG